MAKYINADYLRAEIDKWVEAMADAVGDYSDGVRFILEHFTFVLDSLQHEQPSERFEKELAKVIVEIVDNKDGDGPSLKEYAKRLFAVAHSVPFVLERPEVDLEREAVQFCFDKGLNLNPYEAKTVARHFYELGQKDAANKYDEIEYNRQRAEEETLGKTLDEAVTEQMEEDGDVDHFVRKGIDEIALKYAKLGAKWMAGQGVTTDGIVCTDLLMIDVPDESLSDFSNSEEVIVQIRKK